MDDTQEFIDTAKEKGFLKMGRRTAEGLWSEDFRRWIEHIGFEHDETVVERDEHSSRHINRYTHSKIDSDVVVRHVAHNEGSKSSWRLS